MTSSFGSTSFGNMAPVSLPSTRPVTDPLTRHTKISSTTSSVPSRRSSLSLLTPGLRTPVSFLRPPRPTLSLNSKPSRNNNSAMRSFGTARVGFSTKPGMAISRKVPSTVANSFPPHPLGPAPPVPRPGSSTFRRELHRPGEAARLLPHPILLRLLSTVRLSPSLTFSLLATDLAS